VRRTGGRIRGVGEGDCLEDGSMRVYLVDWGALRFVYYLLFLCIE
jgi:hypothetical protein